MQQKLLTATVCKIDWERIHLHLYVKIEYAQGADRKAPLHFYFVDSLYRGQAKAKIIDVQDDVYHLKLNITNRGNKECVPAGAYNLIVVQDAKMMAKAVIDRAIVPKMSDHSRNFLYNARHKVYTVTFYVTEGEDDLPFTMYILASGKVAMNSVGMGKGHKKTTLNPVAGAKNWYAHNNRAIKADLYNRYHKQFFKKDGKVILIMSEQSETISTNLAAVRDRILERGMDKQGYTVLESYRSSMTNPKMGKKSWNDTLKKMAMANFIILDDHAPLMDWLQVSKDTTVVQIWHAGAGFKSSGYSRWGHIGCPAPNSCHRQYSYGIAGSKSIAPFFSEVWGINDANVLPTGMPRIDEFLNEEHRKKKTAEIYEQYPLCKGKKVILFAPTYRGRNKASAHYPYELIDFDRLYEVCGDDYVVLFKMHPWVPYPVPIPEQYKDKFVDVNLYPNINDLFYITELLITDYSSNIFEYSLMRKPMLFFAFDEIQYSFSRGFHRDYRESTPGKVVETFDELLTAIENKDFEYEKVDEYVEKHFDYIDTHASDRVIDWIILGNIPEDIRKEIAADEAIQEELRTLDFTPKEVDK